MGSSPFAPLRRRKKCFNDQLELIPASLLRSTTFLQCSTLILKIIFVNISAPFLSIWIFLDPFTSPQSHFTTNGICYQFVQYEHDTLHSCLNPQHSDYHKVLLTYLGSHQTLEESFKQKPLLYYFYNCYLLCSSSQQCYTLLQLGLP